MWPILKPNRAGLFKEELVDVSLLLETGMAVATDVGLLVWKFCVVIPFLDFCTLFATISRN